MNNAKEIFLYYNFCSLYIYIYIMNNAKEIFLFYHFCSLCVYIYIYIYIYIDFSKSCILSEVIM